MPNGLTERRRSGCRTPSWCGLFAAAFFACHGADDTSLVVLPAREAPALEQPANAPERPNAGASFEGALRGRLERGPHVAWGPLPAPADSDRPPGAGNGDRTSDAGVLRADAGGFATEEIPSAVGRRCELAEDCGEGLECLRSDSDPFGLGGGPPGGYCSQACEAAQGCSLPGTVCVGGHCLARCALGDASACGGRADVACSPLGAGSEGYCRPQCTSDAECGERLCSVGRGLCIDPPPCQSDSDCSGGSVCDLTARACIPAPPIPAGGACSQDGDCAENVCWSDAKSGTASCTGFCELYTPRGCEAYGSNAFCLLPLDDTHGYCLALCNAPEDCPQAGFLCLTVGSINGRSGVCVPPNPAAL